MPKKLILYPVFMLMITLLILAVLEFSAKIYMNARGHLNEYAAFIEKQGVKPGEKAPGELRVFIVGESAARGVPYSLESSLTGFLGELVAQSGASHVRIVSAAVPGKHSFWQKEHAKVLTRYGADAVVIYAGNNDTRDFSNVMRDVPFAFWDFKLFWYSDFYRLLKRQMISLQKSINKRMKEKIFEINRNQDDVWHWTDHYLQRKKAYLEDPKSGIARRAQAIRDYHDNLDAMIRHLKKKRVKIFIAELPIVHKNAPVIGDWSRKGLKFEQKVVFQTPEEEAGWKRLISEGKDALEKGDFQQALASLHGARAINDTYPMLAHYLAQAYEGLGHFDMARKMYTLGKDLQIQSSGGDSHKRAALRALAQKHDAVWIDLQTALEELSTNGITGQELFLDHCHPNILGHKIIAAKIMEAFCSSDFIDCSESAWQFWLEKLLNGKSTDQNLAQEHLLTAFYLFNGAGWYETPDYAGAISYLEMVTSKLPEDKRPYPFLAASYWHLGNKERARENLDILQRLDAQEYDKALKDFPFLNELLTLSGEQTIQAKV